jgi:uncharacterized membrane protein YiaA
MYLISWLLIAAWRQSMCRNLSLLFFGFLLFLLSFILACPNLFEKKSFVVVVTTAVVEN